VNAFEVPPDLDFVEIPDEQVVGCSPCVIVIEAVGDINHRERAIVVHQPELVASHVGPHLFMVNISSRIVQSPDGTNLCDAEYLAFVCLARTTSTGGSAATKKAPAPSRGSLEARSVRGIPDYGKQVVVVLSGGATEIGIELLRSEGRIGKAERYIFLTGRFRAFEPTGTDLNVMRCTT